MQKPPELGLKHKVWNEGGASSHHEDLTNRPVLTQLLSEVEREMLQTYLFLIMIDFPEMILPTNN